MYGGGAINTWTTDQSDISSDFRMMSLTFIPVVDKPLGTKRFARVRAHFTTSWSDYPNGNFGNWTCEDTQAMEDGTFADSKPWTAEENLAYAFYIMIYSYMEYLGCWLANYGDGTNCGW